MVKQLRGRIRANAGQQLLRGTFFDGGAMYKFQSVTKSEWVSIVAAALISFGGMPLASASSFTYDLTDLSGSITTNCDNCVLTSSDITGWSMSLPGFLSLASTTPGAQVSVPAGDTDMVATPTAINFSFNAPFGGFSFGTSSGSVAYVDDRGDNIGFGPGEGIIAACKNDAPGDCMFFGGGSGTRSIGLAAAAPPASAPELDPASLVGGLTLLFGLLAVFRGRRPLAPVSMSARVRSF
jgi:hypothetical protein